MRTNIKSGDRINPTSTTDSSTYQSAGWMYEGIADGNQGYFGLGRTLDVAGRYNF